MRKIKALLTGFLCAAMLIPSINTEAVVINRHSMDTETDSSSDPEEKTEVETTIDKKTEDIDVPYTEIIDEELIEPADIVFVIDSTGSMAPYIQNVADNVEAFSRYLEGKGVDVRMAVIEYKDITCDGKDSTIVHTIDGSPWHKSTAELVKTLQIVKKGVNGGGDNPETLFDALGYVVDGKTFDFGRKDTDKEIHKFAIVLSDADFKEDNTFGYTEASIIQKLKEQRINTSIITDTMYKSDYKDIINSTEIPGKILDIESKRFSDDLTGLADVIFKTIQTEVTKYKKETVESIKVTCIGNSTIKVGNSTTLKAIILPETAENKKVEWVVSDKNIADIEVSENTLECTVTGVNEGVTKITAKTEDGGFTGSYDIKVFEGGSSSGDNTEAIEISKEDVKVTPAKKTISKNKSFNIKVELKKEFTKDKEEEEIDDIWESNVDSITYRSSKSSVASVNEDGKVTAKKKGKAIIKTILTLADGKEYIYKTTVYVK